MANSKQESNNQKSKVKNPGTPEYNKAKDNRAKQLDPKRNVPSSKKA